MKTTYGWNSGGNGTNSSGFAGLPGGVRSSLQILNYSNAQAGENGYWWSSSDSGYTAWIRALNEGHDNVYRVDYEHSEGFSIRCIKD